MIILLVTSSGYSQQRVQFTQYMFNGLAINPAYAGADEALSLTFMNRSQWRGLDGAPVTQTLSGHTLFKNKHVGLGFTIMSDKIGVHKNKTAQGSFAYHLPVARKSYLSFGLQAGLNNQKSDYGSIANTANPDPKLIYSASSQSFVDFGVGLYLRTPKYDVGLSLPNMVSHETRLNDTLMIKQSRANYFLFAKYKIALTDNIDFEPGLLLKYLHGVPLSYDLNANVIVSKALTLGLSYRKKESVDFLMKVQISQQLQLGYAYDFVLGSASTMAGSSHELMVNYVFKYTHRKLSSPR
jgi:type IX secretion system PorP/SprF family membrane protein